MFFTFLIGDAYIYEKKNGYIRQILSRYSKRKWILSRYGSSFLLSFLVVFITTCINFLLAYILFSKGLSFFSMQQHREEEEGFMRFMLYHPYATQWIYTLIFSLLAGLSGILSSAISYIVPKLYVVYPIMLFVWFALINWSEYPILALTQSYNTWEIKKLLVPGITYLLITVVFALIGYLYRGRVDEL